MRKMIFEAGDEHDRVLSFHRNIGGGRSIEFAPLLPRPEVSASEVRAGEKALYTTALVAASLTAPEKSMKESTTATTTVAYSQRLELLSAPKPDLFSDEAVFAPKFDIVELKTSQAKLLAALAASVNGPDPSEEANVESLRRRLDDLTGWFQNFGKDGVLVKTSKTFTEPEESPEVSTELLTAEPGEKSGEKSTEESMAETSVDESRQAA
jgi:hypothetical protein